MLKGRAEAPHKQSQLKLDNVQGQPDNNNDEDLDVKGY